MLYGKAKGRLLARWVFVVDGRKNKEEKEQEQRRRKNKEEERRGGDVTKGSFTSLPVAKLSGVFVKQISKPVSQRFIKYSQEPGIMQK